METILEVKDLFVDLKQKKMLRPLLSDVSFTIHAGECLGVLGESGSGKSMTAKAVTGLLGRGFAVSGAAYYRGGDLLKESEESLRKLRGKKICMVLQNPMTCFDPLYRVGAQMQETFAVHTDWRGEEMKQRMIDVLEQMQIRQPEEVLQKYPHQLSGGMLQRIMIGIAMATKPDLLIADEPTTAIDAITQYEIVQEFLRIKRESQTAMLFITHDLSVISRLADDILVMNSGRMVDRGSFQHILHHAEDPYTRLLAANKQAVMAQYREVVHSCKGEEVV